MVFVFVIWYLVGCVVCLFICMSVYGGWCRVGCVVVVLCYMDGMVTSNGLVWKDWECVGICFGTWWDEFGNIYETCLVCTQTCSARACTCLGST